MTDAYSDLLGDDEDDSQSDDKPEAKPNNQLSAAQRKLAKAEKELEELRAFRAERVKSDRENSITKVFSEVGLDPRHARLFAALNPEGEATAELVATFANEYGLVATTGEEVEAPAAPERGFTPTVIAEGQALGAKVYSVAEWRQLARDDPAQAEKVFDAKRVNLAAIQIGPDR